MAAPLIVLYGVYSDNVKHCGRCGSLKPLEEFHRSSRSGTQSWCKTCRQEYDRAYHSATRELRIAQKRAWKAKRIDWIRSLKAGRPCADCGGTFPPVAMQWDHRPGEQKFFDVSSAAPRRAKRAVIAEIRKCDLVCANCHAMIHLGGECRPLATLIPASSS